MTRNEGLGLGLAVAGHVALFALLSLAWSNGPKPPEVAKPIEVSLVDAVALDQHAPKAAEPPAQSAAPDPGPPADAPPPPKAVEVEPDPTPPKPVPAKPAPPKPAPPKPDAVPPPKPAPKPVPAPKKPVAEAAAKPTKPSPAKTAPAKSAAPATKAVAATKTGTGSNAKASKAKPTGSLLDDDFRKGLTQSPSKSKAPDAAPGATMDAKASANIASAIQRQIQPCADRQVNPGPGASRIVVTIRLSLNRDGTVNGRPTVADNHGGVDDENRRYVDAVDRNAIAAFAGCAPLRGLPPELYDVPRGWKTVIMHYHLPG